MSSWDDVYSIKTYDLPNLESPNWFVTYQLIVWIIPIRKVFQLRFHTLDTDGVTAIAYDWSSRCISQVRCPRRNLLASDSACVTGTLTLTWAESADSLCRGRPRRTLSLVREGLTESWRPQQFQQTRFETFVLRNPNRLFICKFCHLCHNISSITIGLICRSYNKFTLFI